MNCSCRSRRKVSKEFLSAEEREVEGKKRLKGRRRWVVEVQVVKIRQILVEVDTIRQGLVRCGQLVVGKRDR